MNTMFKDRPVMGGSVGSAVEITSWRGIFWVVLAFVIFISGSERLGAAVDVVELA
jgi:hypothetical protein